MTAPPKKTILEARQLSVAFPSKKQENRVVDELSFQLFSGETLGIVGESGSGKSMTALSLMQLLPRRAVLHPESEIILHRKNGESIDLTGQKPAVMRQIRGNEMSMIFQEPMTSLNPVFACGEQVAESLILHQGLSGKQARVRTIELFREANLPRPEKIYTSYPHQISGGQKQRVMIAMAMACNPSLLIADEPTTALDVTVQKNILQLMNRLREQHDTSILFITHDLGVIAEIADKVMVMYQGKIVEFGSVWDIFSHPQHPYTKGLLACRPRLDVSLSRLPTVSDFMQVNEKGALVEKKGKYNSVGEAILFNAESPTELIEKRMQVIKSGPILKIKNLKTYFPLNLGFFSGGREFVKAVDNVSFEVYPGEAIGLVGESGCGKTTLGRSILKLVEPTSGFVFFEGQLINYMKKRQLRQMRKHMQIIFQDPYSSLNPRKTIGDTIMEPMKQYKIGRNKNERIERVMQLLEKVDIPRDSFYKYPHEFSGGQRQRICIARALAVEPKLIICDESVSALDVSVQAQVLNLLNDLKNEFNFTYIFISHDLSVVKFIADRILVMKNGKLVEMGYPDALFARPKEPYTRSLIDAIPKGDLEDIKKAQLQRKLSAQ
ncbi:MAG TPA: ABC transporter ATP-binding protein [Cytophagales bacterium]|jgi:peptide/nickel transport system ATP-binding protein|nr:ABC transporter ATP-binding protein [Cytophagales bacterium]